MATRDRVTPEEEDFVPAVDFTYEISPQSGLGDILEHITHIMYRRQYGYSPSESCRYCISRHLLGEKDPIPSNDPPHSSALLSKAYDYDIEVYASPTLKLFPDPLIFPEEIVTISAKDKRTFTSDKKAVVQVLGINLKDDTPLAHNKTASNKKYHQARHRR